MTDEKPSGAIKAYKGFNADLTYGGFRYEVGKEYEYKNYEEVCESRFRAYENPMAEFAIFPPGKSVFHEITLSGKTYRQDDNSRIAATHIKIGARLDIAGLCKAALKYVKSHCTNEINAEPGGAASAGDYGAATAGDCGAAAVSDYGAAVAGICGAASAGDCGVATAGYSGAATAGNGGAASAGFYGVASAGYNGAATAGFYGVASSRGSSSTEKKWSIGSPRKWSQSARRLRSFARNRRGKRIQLRHQSVGRRCCRRHHHQARHLVLPPRRRVRRVRGINPPGK